MEYETHAGIFTRTGILGRQDCDVVGEVICNDGYRTSLRGHRGPGEIVVDIGAHIGCFGVLWHNKNPGARIACVEVCPENIPVLQANVGQFAQIINAACSYDPGDLWLLNSVKEGGTATGGSIVIPAVDRNDVTHLHWQDQRPIRKVTLEEIMASLGTDHIDVLKLDCEGSEFSILEHTPSLDRIGIIFGEYHGQERWDELRERKFQGWDYGNMHAAGGLGIFHLVNPRGAP